LSKDEPFNFCPLGPSIGGYGSKNGDKHFRRPFWGNFLKINNFQKLFLQPMTPELQGEALRNL